MNKKSILLLPIILSIIIILPFVIAQEDTISSITSEETQDLEASLTEIDAGTTPDSFFWGIDVALDRIKFNLARDKEAAGLKIAHERLAELKVMSKEGKMEAAEKASKNHKEFFDKIKARLEVSSDEDEKTLKKTVRLENALEEHQNQIEELKERLSNLTPEQKRRMLAFLNSMEENSDKMAIEIENKEDKILTKLKQKTGRSGLELRDSLNRLKEEKKIKAEVFDDLSIIKVEYRFQYRSENTNTKINLDRIISRLVDRIATSEEEANRLLKIERGDDDDEASHDFAHALQTATAVSSATITAQATSDSLVSNDAPTLVASSDDNNHNEGSIAGRLKVKIDLKQREDRTEARIDFRLRFVIDSTDREDIIESIVKQTNALTVKEILNAVRAKESDFTIGNKGFDGTFDEAVTGVIEVEDDDNSENDNENSCPYSNIEDYQNSIDYSCNEDSNCEIKNVGTICGYYPKCVNEDTTTYPECPSELAGEGSGGNCGFPEIDGCVCIESSCKGFQENPDGTISILN